MEGDNKTPQGHNEAFVALDLHWHSAQKSLIGGRPTVELYEVKPIEPQKNAIMRFYSFLGFE
jgi:hypothetical protein